MAHIERKLYYVGTWREDKVTDGTMRQIIARSLAEKGQKVKIKLSRDGLVLTKTVLFQENLVSAQALHDVYFLTVNQRQPCCLLCIVADPVRRYLILALKTSNPVEAQEIISTFKALKDNPTIDSGNVVLRRKDNGNWTLRERSQLNANRHLQEIFKDDQDPATSQSNGSAGGSHVPVIDGSSQAAVNRRQANNNRLVVPGGEGIIGDDGDDDGVVIVAPDAEVDDLSQELQDVKFVVEKSGSLSPANLHRNTSRRSNTSRTSSTAQPHHHLYHHHNNNNDDNDPDKYYIETEVITTTYPEPILNGEVIQVHGNSPTVEDKKPGQVTAVVQDHRDDGVVRAHSNGSSAVPVEPAVFIQNGHQLTVPEPIATSHIAASSDPNVVYRHKAAPSGYTNIPDYKIHRRVSTEYVAVPDLMGRKVSQTGSLRSNTISASRVSFDPELARRGSRDPRQVQSLRTTRLIAAPTTIVRPIEHVYGHHYHPRPSILKRQPGSGLYVASPATAYVVAEAPPQPAGNMMYVPAGSLAGSVSRPPSQRGRKPRPNSIHVMEGNELKVFHKTGEADDILL